MKVLFVCSGNAFRSPVVEALLKKMKPELKVDSAGTNPAIPISESVKSYLTRKNAVHFLKQNPENIIKKDLNRYDLIIAMELKHKEVILSRCPECLNKKIVWDIEDPYFLPCEHTNNIFKQIRQKVMKLTDNL